MPTGYTHKVQSGEIADFSEFAMQCARAFGACIDMRDEPADAPIPDEFKPSDYNLRELEKAKHELSLIEAMTTDQKDAAVRSANQQAMENWRKRRQEIELHHSRYAAMLHEAMAWKPPTAEHIGLKEFMITQLEKSIDFDCHDPDRPQVLKRDEWYASALQQARHAVFLHENAHAEEVERAKKRTSWVQALRQSLGA